VPEGWAGLFTGDPKVVEATVAYITRVAPFYCLFGLGMTLSFASQGAGRMKAPFAAGIARMIVATVGGWFAVEILGWGLPGVFTAVAAGMIVFGSLIAGPLLVIPWGPKRQRMGRVKLSPVTGASDAAPLDDRNLEPQSR
jgi:Na+-driven multidrug efflux pump